MTLASTTRAAWPRLVDRLHPHLRGSILFLAMEDHYVRVRTELGSTLLLLRFGDAIAELDGIEGARVHRSWWVAKDAIVSVTKTGRTASLRLIDGTAVPVSQPYLAVATMLATAGATICETRP